MYMLYNYALFPSLARTHSFPASLPHFSPSPSCSLCYVNTLLAPREVIWAVLATTDLWFGTLLKIVDINTTSGEEES